MSSRLKKILFFDTSLVNSISGDVKIVSRKPDSVQIAFEREYPWENFLFLYSSFIYDKEANEYRIYYGARDKKGSTRLCVAVSKDGIHYVKPCLKVYDYCGSKENNIVRGFLGDGSVYYDADAKNGKRYILFSHSDLGLFVTYSEDGIHWSDECTVLAETFNDGHNTVFYDKYIGEYRFYLRGWTGKPHRRIALSGSSKAVENILADLPYEELRRRKPEEKPYIGREFLHTVLIADEQDPPKTDIYTFSPSPYPCNDRYYICFPAYYKHLPGPSQGGNFENDGYIESYICTSVDGLSWNRPDRVPYICNTEEGFLHNKMAYMCGGIHRVGDSMLTVGTLYDQTHGDVESRRKFGDGRMMLFTQRADGYVCASFEGGMGELILTELCLGEKITINARTYDKGVINVYALKGEQELFIGDFQGDSVKYELMLPRELCGSSAKLKFVGENSELYCIDL